MPSKPKSIIYLEESNIQNKIFTIREIQVMLDNDLAYMYQVETKQLNRAVSRNIDRFPERFRFQLTQEEYDDLRFQNGTSSSEHGGRRYLPYVFTEQGISMLSAVLRSETAISVSIKIIDSFVHMRRFMSQNALLFQKIEVIEMKQQNTDKKLVEVLNAIEDKTISKKQGIFFDGQIFDAYVFISSLIKEAKYSIVLIDNYIDESTLIHLNGKVDKNVKIIILTKSITKAVKLDMQKHAEQYEKIEIKELKQSHDRFLLIDDKVYHLGASLKDLGKKWFAFSLMEEDSMRLKEKIEKVLKNG